VTHRRRWTSVGSLPLGTDGRISSPTMQGLSENGALAAAREQGPGIWPELLCRCQDSLLLGYGANELAAPLIRDLHAPAGSRAVTSDSACTSRHATWCPSPRSSSCGSTFGQRAKASGHRGWKRQPDGRSMGSGVSP
jgi:hypothetical protein